MSQEQTTTEKRIAQDKELLLEHLAGTAIVEIACQKAEIGRSTYYRYRQQDPEFAKKADEAMRSGTLLVNDMAESYLISAIKSKNMSAITLWLRTHHPAYTTKVEVNGEINHPHEKLTVEQQRVVEEALRLASIVTKQGIKNLQP